MAESDFFLGRSRPRSVRTCGRSSIGRAARRSALLRPDDDARLGRDEFASHARALVDAFPDSSWAEDALNNLASFLIVDDEDEHADEVLRELARRFPSGRYTARASWRTGWWAYRRRRFAEAADVFERAAAAFPRSDYRPSYLYWAAKAREQRGDATGAERAIGWSTSTTPTRTTAGCPPRPSGRADRRCPPPVWRPHLGRRARVPCRPPRQPPISSAG